MTWSFPIGRLLGSEVRVHATFFLLILWIAVAAYVDGGWPAAVINTLFILALFACVVAHEFGHALMARRFGIKTPDITLLPIGGLARLENMPEKPRQEILVALAGPAVNVVIWIVLVAILGARTDLSQLESIDDPAVGFLGRLAAVNLFLVLFNMIPAFPMDGGRVFRATLSIWLGRVRATRAAARAGQVIAFGFGLTGLLTGNLLLMLIAVFVFAAASAESSDVAMRDTLRGLVARDAMITSFETLSPDDGLAAMSSGLLRTTQAEFPVLDRDGSFVGVLTRQAIYDTATHREGQPHVEDRMIREIPVVSLTTPMQEVLRALGQASTPAVAVVGRDGSLLGYINRENIGEMMVLREARS